MSSAPSTSSGIAHSLEDVQEHRDHELAIQLQRALDNKAELVTSAPQTTPPRGEVSEWVAVKGIPRLLKDTPEPTRTQNMFELLETCSHPVIPDE